MTAKREAQGAGSLLSRILSSRHAVKRTFEQRQRDVQAEQAAAAKRTAALRGSSTALQPGASALPAQPAEGSAAVPSDGNPAGATVAPARFTTPASQLPLFRSRAFYSAKRLQQVEDRILRFLANVQARLGSASGGGVEAEEETCWHTFPLQQPAFDCADRLNSAAGSARLRVFSAEMGPEGKRRFLVASYAQCWRRYRDMLPQHRHYYEIVRQGWPCHLYFDLEYGVADNPGADGAAAVDALLALVAELLLERFGLAYDPSWALELDSSTPTKFSRHLIVRLPGAAFASNAHVGAFVRELCGRAVQRREEDPCAARLFISKGGEQALFVDLGVYTRNRAFRLYLSSKAGKEAVLDCTGRFGGASLTQQEVYERTLICNVDPDATLLRCYDEGAGDAGGTAAAALRQLAGVPRDALPAGGSGGAAQVHYGPSPFPLIEEFICSVCTEGGCQGAVRSWALLDGGSLLLLNMRGNRWCGNVGRAHKSNGIFYVVDLQQGWWCQRCYDPECRGYRSPLTALPEGLLALYQRPSTAQQEQAWEEGSPVGPAHASPQPAQPLPRAATTDAAAVPSGEQAAAIGADGRGRGRISQGAEQQGPQPLVQPPHPHQPQPLLPPQPQPAMPCQQHWQQHAQPPWQQPCTGGGSLPAWTALPQGQPPQQPHSWSLHGSSQQASCSPSLPVAGGEGMRGGSSAGQPVPAHATSRALGAACAGWDGSSCPGSAAPWPGRRPAGAAWDGGCGEAEDIPDELMLEALQQYESRQGSALHAQHGGGAGGQKGGGRGQRGGSGEMVSTSLAAPFLLDLCQL